VGWYNGVRGGAGEIEPTHGITVLLHWRYFCLGKKLYQYRTKLISELYNSRMMKMSFVVTNLMQYLLVTSIIIHID